MKNYSVDINLLILNSDVNAWFKAMILECKITTLKQILYAGIKSFTDHCLFLVMHPEIERLSEPKSYNNNFNRLQIVASITSKLVN